MHDLRMSGKAWIQGRVTERATGRPLEGVSIDLFRILESGEVAPQPLQTAVSAKDGSYRFQELEPGAFRIEPRWNPPSGPGPSAILNAGGEVTQDLQLPIPCRLATLRVKFRDGSGKPVTGVLLRVYNPRTGETFSHESGSRSEVTSQIFAGDRYEVSGDRTLPGVPREVMSGSVAISLAGDTNDVTIVLLPLP